MHPQQQRSKKTVGNQLNVKGNTDNRRLNTDIVPSVYTRWGTNPELVNGGTSLGSSANYFNRLYADANYTYAPKIPLIWVGSGAPSGNPNTTYQGIWWYMDSATVNGRTAYYWSGSAWVADTPVVGQVFITFNATPDRYLFIYSGSGTGKGWVRSSQYLT